MRVSAQKPARQTISAGSAGSPQAQRAPVDAVSEVLRLQRTVGNKAARPLLNQPNSVHAPLAPWLIARQPNPKTPKCPINA